MMIAVVTDLIFGTKITGTAKALGKPFGVARNLDRLRALLDEAPESPLVIVDLNSNGVDTVEAVRVAKGHAKNARVVAFLSHVQVELAQQAKEAGADRVMARSGFVEALPGMLAAE
jgi:DNA-binding NarL/FixJ family response regulator